jgi:hypothetical protein
MGQMQTKKFKSKQRSRWDLVASLNARHSHHDQDRAFANNVKGPASAHHMMHEQGHYVDGYKYTTVAMKVQPLLRSPLMATTLVSFEDY